MDIFYPIQQLATTITYDWLKIAPSSYLGNALSFFIYDTFKIGLLLVLINYLMAITRYYFPANKVKNILVKRHWYGIDYLLAALLGVVTPFCSCSSIPLFIAFLSAGIPLGVTLSFLIASPLINEASLILFPAVFGWKTTLIYNFAGIVVAIISGMILQKMHLEKYVNQDLLKFKTKTDIEAENGGERLNLKKLLSYWWIESFKLSKTIYPYVLLGVGIGAIIHGFVPQSLIENYLSNKSWFMVPVATLIGVPLYASSITILPLVEVLINKGVAMGTALAFMTGTVALSLPAALILKKVMKWQLLLAFFTTTIIGIIIIGYLLNFLTL